MGIVSKGPRIMLRELRRGCTVSGREVGPRWTRWPRCGSSSPMGEVTSARVVLTHGCDLRNFAGEELRSKPCAENLAVHSGMTSGLVELAVGIILELVPGPGISGSLSLFGVDSIMDLIRISSSLASLSALAAVDPSLILGQSFLLYPIEVFFFLCHGPFERRVLPSGLASCSSWMDVGISVRVIGLVAYVQIDPLDIASSLLSAGGGSPIARSLEIESSAATGSCGPARDLVAPRGILWPRAGSCGPARDLVAPRGILLLAFAVKYHGVRSDRGYVSSWSSVSVGIDGCPVPCEPVAVSCSGSEPNSRPVSSSSVMGFSNDASCRADWLRVLLGWTSAPPFE
ncbi:hypothetical protein F2Q69_00052535 [Brassica cretica]|uniref:Uncharacterized protein n=1 Tax=Brassica cretica TaxID=69181 RepID=A0A8S9N7R7_BRACR|nr:hypothetical protein F2Q69_00052535 [Brassica cretica]